MTYVKADEFFKHVPMQSDATLRDYFAAKAMQGICSANPKATYEEVSAFAYQMADAMLRAREAV
jgi:hypothetical protein